MSPRITGTQMNYYEVCKRKLWLFLHQIEMEQESNAVQQGKQIDESTYAREKHQVEIGDAIVLDFVDLRNGVIHEVKKSDAVEQVHLWQVKYYLYHLKTLGLTVAASPTGEGITAEIDYPKLKRRETVLLTAEDEQELLRRLDAIATLTASSDLPEKIDKRFCKTCAYYELCWS